MNTVTLSIKEEEMPDLHEAGEIIRKGGLVAFPTETVYGLGGNALDPKASAKIYAAKGRPSDNPLIVHIAEREELTPLVKDVPPVAEALMNAFWPGPMTIILNKTDMVPYETTGGLDTVAVRMPSDPIARAFIKEAGVPIAAPSANTSGRPSPTRAEHVQEDMNGKIEMIIDGGQVGIGLESTIIDCTGKEPVILRPGFISQEMLEQVVGNVSVDRASTEKMKEGEHPKAPGMKYRHYAPKAALTIFSGEQAKVIETINRLAAKDTAEGRRVGIIGTDETADCYKYGEFLSIGSRASTESVAHNLYALLRECDARKMDIIYSESFEGDGLCTAVMNRLQKAAGYHIVRLS